MTTVSSDYKIRELDSHIVPNTLINKLMDVAESAFGYPMPKEEVESVARKSTKLLVVSKNGLPVAFASYKMLNSTFAYLSGSCVHSDHKHEGIYTELVDRRIEMLRGKVNHISTRTQSPVVYRVFSAHVQDLYPSENRVTTSILKMARLVDGRVGEDMVVRGCYGRRLSKLEPPMNKVESLDLFNKLNLENGDAFVLIGSIQ